MGSRVRQYLDMGSRVRRWLDMGSRVRQYLDMGSRGPLSLVRSIEELLE